MAFCFGELTTIFVHLALVDSKSASTQDWTEFSFNREIISILMEAAQFWPRLHSTNHFLSVAVMARKRMLACHQVSAPFCVVIGTDRGAICWAKCLTFRFWMDELFCMAQISKDSHYSKQVLVKCLQEFVKYMNRYFEDIQMQEHPYDLHRSRFDLMG